VTDEPVAREKPLVLVADDDEDILDLVTFRLEHSGYAVIQARDGEEALERAMNELPDLAVLDVMMPKVDGLDVCRVLRADDEVPIIMLTARSTEDDLLLGLDLGADDYLTKPYNPRELVARVRTVLRRTRSRAEGEVYRVGELEIDPIRHEIRLAGRLVDVTPAEFKILACLAASPGRAFSRQQLLEHAFGFDHYVFDRTIDVHVMNLRKKIEPSPAAPAYLKTVYGVGYKLAEKVHVDAS
jgi:DNA-binding response OmpR family regulator